MSIAVVDLLQELTDIDTLHESEEGAEVLIDALVSGSCLRVSWDCEGVGLILGTVHSGGHRILSVLRLNGGSEIGMQLEGLSSVGPEGEPAEAQFC